ncbi:MAG: hypothetical protein CMO55_12395 [Verrucomicrobiales bacterium]|nr:hypothetical protein [Verrucomicrobiales bacterium]
MLTERELESDFGPERKVDFLARIFQHQADSDCVTPSLEHGTSSLFQIGIYDGEMPDLQTNYRTGDSDQ